MKRRTAVLASALALAGAGCSDETLTLGRGEPPVPELGEPINVSRAVGTDTDNEDNPTLTADLLTLFFTSNRKDPDDDTDVDVWIAERDHIGAPFRDARRLRSVSSPGFDTSPAISADGLTLWVGSEVPGSDADGRDEDIDIYRFTRSSRTSDDFDAAGPETALNSSAKDIPRPLALNERVMPLGSQRDGGAYQTYLAERGPDGDFRPPQLVGELAGGGRATVDAFLSSDGRLLFFNWEARAGRGEIYMAWRRSPEDPFEEPLPLTAINTDGDERDPWISPDGTRFFYTSDRDSPDPTDPQLDIFEVPIRLPRFD